MSSFIRKSKRVWTKIIHWCGLGQSNKRRKPVDHILVQETQKTTPLQEARMTNAKRSAHPEPPLSTHPSHRPGDSPSPGAKPPVIFPEFAHLVDQEKPRNPRFAFLRRDSIAEGEEEELRRGPTPLLANRKMHAKRKVTGGKRRVSNDLQNEDDERPLADFMPRGHKLVSSPSRNHLDVVPKSPMSPLNACHNAPANQGRRTPFNPRAMASMSEVQASIEEVASLPSIPRSLRGPLHIN